MKIKILSLSIFLLLANLVRAQSNFSEYLELMKKKEVASYDVDMNNDGKLDNIKFKFPATSEHPKFSYSDPGVSNILEIIIADGEKFLLDEAFDSLAAPIRNNQQNRISSDLVFLTKPLNGFNYLLISGPEYGCCIGKLFIFKISKNRVEPVHNDEFEVYNFSYDPTGDKYLFEGRTYLGEMWGGNKTDYYFQNFNFSRVYSLQSTFALDAEETRKLNTESIAKFGDFLDFSYPVLVINKQTKEELLINYDDDIKYDYELKYDDLSRSKLNPEYFNKFSKTELRIMRNEIFASYGYIFNSQDLQEHFNSKKWYKPTSKNVDDKLTEIEKHNIQLIVEAEKAP